MQSVCRLGLKSSHIVDNTESFLMSLGWRHLITWMDSKMWGIWMAFSFGWGEIWTIIFQKVKCPGGCQWGEFQFDWYINWHHPKLGTWKIKPIIDLSRNIILMTHMTFIFLKVFWIRTNTANLRGKNSINNYEWTIKGW